MWCGTGKTVTFTISIFEDKTSLNVIVFPSLGLINQYSNDYFLNENFKKGFEKFMGPAASSALAASCSVPARARPGFRVP